MLVPGALVISTLPAPVSFILRHKSHVGEAGPGLTVKETLLSSCRFPCELGLPIDTSPLAVLTSEPPAAIVTLGRKTPLPASPMVMVPPLLASRTDPSNGALIVTVWPDRTW